MSVKEASLVKEEKNTTGCCPERKLSFQGFSEMIIQRKQRPTPKTLGFGLSSGFLSMN